MNTPKTASYCKHSWMLYRVLTSISVKFFYIILEQ